MSDAQARSELSKSLRRAYEILSHEDPLRNHTRTIHLDGRRILGIDCQLESAVDLTKLRRSVLQAFNCDGAGILQVVGDSGRAFDQAGVRRVVEILSDQVGAKCVIEYGYTASKHDANWLVAEHIAKSPEIGPRVIANVVGQSIDCLQDPSWSGSLEVTNFVMLFDCGAYTKFGQDVWLSDGIMSSESDDKMICFEGGLQAFRQGTNALVKGIHVVAVTNLRQSESRQKFSAARLLLILRKTDTDVDARNRADEYLTQLLDQSEKQTDTVRTQVNGIIVSKFDWRSLILEK